MVIRCVGCGGDITNAKGKRTLCSEASQHVEPLWCQLFDEELRRKGGDRDADDLVTIRITQSIRHMTACFFNHFTEREHAIIIDIE